MDKPKQAYQMILDNLYDGIYFVDADRVIGYWNKGAERITGFSAAEVIGRSCADNILTHVDASGNKLCLSMCPLHATMEDKKDRQADVFLHHKSGHRVPVSVRVSPLYDEQERLLGAVEIFTDISNYKSIEQKIKELEEMALLDQLTRLANRHYIEKEFSAVFEEQKRYGMSFGLLLMDIDFFKKVNDTFGHDVGDRTLKSVAETLVNSARPFDLIGRWGGEEFIAILRNVSKENLEVIGNRMRMLVENSYLLVDSKKLQVTVSMGATLVRPDETVETLIKRADRLLYQSKDNGRNCLTLG
ncbi:MAG: GGDEF domain-containing protein [Smithellaceae bacterium]